MVLRRVMGMMMGCLGMSCLRRSDQATRPLSPAPSESCDDHSSTASSDDVKSSSSSETSKESSCGRIKLSDGRLLAYKERGVPKSEASYRVVIVHGFASSKEMNFMASQKLIDELGIYLLQFDRAGYGESDPNPKRSLKSEASDIEELADQLQLGSKLAGVALVVPFINYRWPSLPYDLIQDDYRKNLSKFMVWIARHTPGLLQWWLTQKMFPSSSVLDRNVSFFSTKDMEVVKNTPGYQLLNKSKLKEEPIFHSLCKDIIVAFGKWDFDPLSLTNPFGGSERRFHIWQGYEDKVVPVELQRYISTRLPWIKYREVPDGGHLLVYDTDVCEAILRSLLLGEDTPLYIPKLDSN
ncbi:lysophospholipase BODYGUARD 1 precursor [Tanacetum coccineum]